MKTSIRLCHWLPRIICILSILFVSMFALDVFELKLTFWQKMIALLMHLIPSLILLALLIIAWKWEYVGGILFIIIGIGISPFVFNMNYNMNHSFWLSLGIILAITFPFVVVGILFVTCHFIKKKNQKKGLKSSNA